MRLLFLFGAILICHLALAQRSGSESSGDRPEKATEMGIQHGLGWYKVFNNAEADGTITINGGEEIPAFLRVTSSNATTLFAEFHVARNFSVGPALGFQRIGFNYDPVDPEVPEGSIRLSRYFISARGLFYYGNNPNFRMYSGLRVGGTVYVLSGDLNAEEADLGTGVLPLGAGGLPHITPILFGFKGYVSDFILGAELATGSPHVLAIQLGYRF